MSAIGDALEYHDLLRLSLAADETAMLLAGNGARVLDGPLLQGVGGEQLLPRRPQLRSKATFGYCVFENNLLQPAWIENGRRCFRRVVAGSTWCASVLTDAGLAGVEAVPHGIDPRIFHPAGDENHGREFLEDKFVVFSGGKFELRKGQDIVIRAYKVLQDRHPDVMLVNAWNNPWPASVETMRASPLIRFAPRRGTCVQVINQVLADNGIDPQRVISCPQELNFALARLYQNSDVGIFPNRCEGGTNLVLMEYMACGKPAITVDTTGHADIVRASNALILGTKGETTVHDQSSLPVARWPEPDLDDAIDKLEWAFQNREKLRPLGHQAAKDLAERTWRRTAEALQKIIHETAVA